MTSAELTTTEESKSQAMSSSLEKFLDKVCDRLEVVVDRLNPIMVKETRQALKSRQFVLTFFLVLIACWVASFAVVAIIGPEVYYVAEGPQMLTYYFCILAFPLMLIVPYTAFRSLAVEQEDNTYELLSISALSPSQIVSGKLGSSIVQMIVYLSAVSPCIAFTFLLRGVDAVTVILLLAYFVLTSLGLSIIALMAGTVARTRFSQVVISVLFVLALALIFWLSITLSMEFVPDSYYYLRDRGFWIANLIFLTAYLTTFALVHACAAAQIAFHSDNRSTPIRRYMLLQQACFLGWMTLALYETSVRNIDGASIFMLSVAGIYWYIMGALLTSEWPYLSRRVQRSLPKSKLGTITLTWLNPGPGTGFMFAVSNFTFIAMLSAALMIYASLMTGRSGNLQNNLIFVVMFWSYFVTFLGLGRLFIGLMRKYIFVSLTAGVLLHLILMLLAVGLPHILDYMSNPQRFGVDYSLIHITNPAWTLGQVEDKALPEVTLLTIIVTMVATAIVIFLLNIRTVWGEIQHQRRALPTRILEDEAELHPDPAEKPQNPWEA